jgi:mono/diheme cytochrome c family protein
MKKIFLPGIVILLLIMNFQVYGQGGEQLFKQICSACHTINKGKLIGPDLSGVYNRRKTDWILSFVKSSQQMVKAGDPEAVAVFNENNKIPMPNNDLTNDQILSIIDYIKSQDKGGAAPAGQQAAQQPAQSPQKDTAAVKAQAQVPAQTPSKAPLQPSPQPTADTTYKTELVPQGRALFNGNVSFANNAPPCMSCHNINDQSVLGGGRLALDLTFAWSKLGPAGIGAILTNPPFPAMKAALINRPLNDDEKTAVISLLKSVDERNNLNPVGQSGGILFFTIAFVAALFLLVHVYVFYDNRNIP